MLSTELFLPTNSSKSFFTVDVVEITTTASKEVMTVSYQEKQYNLTWSDFHQEYSGEVAGIKGSIQ